MHECIAQLLLRQCNCNDNNKKQQQRQHMNCFVVLSLLIVVVVVLEDVLLHVVVVVIVLAQLRLLPLFQVTCKMCNLLTQFHATFICLFSCCYCCCYRCCKCFFMPFFAGVLLLFSEPRKPFKVKSITIT